MSDEKLKDKNTPEALGDEKIAEVDGGTGPELYPRPSKCRKCGQLYKGARCPCEYN